MRVLLFFYLKIFFVQRLPKTVIVGPYLFCKTNAALSALGFQCFFAKVYLIKIGPNFVGSALFRFKKYLNFLWIWSFYSQVCLIFYAWSWNSTTNIAILPYLFLKNTTAVGFNASLFAEVYLIKIGPFFVLGIFPLNFLWICSFIYKSLPNFLYSTLKLHKYILP